jgi:hypothetical protein
MNFNADLSFRPEGEISFFNIYFKIAQGPVLKLSKDLK